jgi:hypothetical protein
MDTVEIDRPAAVETPASKRECPPGPAAPLEERRTWCRSRVDARAQTHPGDGLPSDVRDTHFWEVEFNCCVLDPAAYDDSLKDEEVTR